MVRYGLGAMLSCLGLLAVALPISGQEKAILVRSAASGPWSSPATWEGGKVPAAGNIVQIREGHTVLYDVESDQVLRSVHIHGTLTFAHDRNTRLEVGLLRISPGDDLIETGFDCTAHPAEAKTKTTGQIDLPGFTAPCLCCQGKAALLVGTPEQPIDARYTALIRLHYIDGMDKDSCPAIINCGGRMDFHGAPMNRTWVKLGATVPDPKKRKSPDDGSSLILAEEVTGWRIGDRILVTSTAINHANDHAPGTFRTNAPDSKLSQYKPFTEERRIKSIKGTRITLERPLDFGHLGEGHYRAEVANLSRNVIVESANPDGVRGHTIYHRGSAGSISYAEFRHLGKQGMLGRYPLHFHLCGDSLRGSAVVGAAIWDSHNRWITVHGTDYLVIRDCVGYQSVGHGFFLEDGSEVYNVFDRNLAVQAFRGAPLPKQILPFDKNEGAGFWWANSLNTFTRNVAVECDQYGFRLEATPGKDVNLTLPVRQPDGSKKAVDIRTLPFVRFEDNEVHSMHNYGLNLGEGTGGVGPDKDHPFVIRNFRSFLVRLAYRPNVPHVLLDKAVLAKNTYGIYQPDYVGHDYRDISWVDARVRRMPGDSAPGDGRGKPRPPDVEVAKLVPVDDLPPITVITDVRKVGNTLIVRGTTSDNGIIKKVLVNGQEARLEDSFGNWSVELKNPKIGLVILRAYAEDLAGNTERTPHELAVSVR
jgi:hypothetical protein